MKLQFKKFQINENTSFGVDVDVTPKEIRELADKLSITYMEAMAKIGELQSKTDVKEEK